MLFLRTIIDEGILKIYLPDDVVLELVVAAQQLDGVVELEVELHIVEVQLQPQVAELAVEFYCSMPINLDPFLMSLLR